MLGMLKSHALVKLMVWRGEMTINILSKQYDIWEIINAFERVLRAQGSILETM